MTAQIIHLRSKRPASIPQNRSAVREPLAREENGRRTVLFQFDSQEYEARFDGADLEWIRFTAYRIQNGKRVRCTITSRRRDPSPELEAAAFAALARPASETRPMWEVDAATLSAVQSVERVKRISNSIGQKIKAGDVPPDFMVEFGEWAHTALDALPPWESESA